MSVCSFITAFMAVVSATRAAVIPSMFLPGGLSMNQNWRPSETYGYLDRHPMLNEADILPAPTQPVYGVPHRYINDPSPYADSTHDIYSNPLFQHRYGGSKRSSYYPNYDLMMEDEALVSDYEPKISEQDVINFEKYVQRYFQQQKEEQQQQDEVGQQYEDWSADEENPENYEENDEEAARQLHLLLANQLMRPVFATREIQKKSVEESAAVKTTTASPVTTQAIASTTAAPAAPQQKGSGQKEEAMLRPAIPQRPSSSPAPAVAAKQTKEENDVYHTLQRLLNLRNQLQQQEDLEASSEADITGRSKRFVAPSQESLLSKQLHSLDKIKA